MRSIRETPLRRSLSVLFAGALVVAACGGDDDEPVATEAPAETAEAEEPAEETAEPPAEEPAEETAEPPAEEPAEETADASAEAEEPAEEAAAEPVKIMVFLDENEAAGITFADNKIAAEARVARINAEGGLGGSGTMVEVEFCLTALDPNLAAECARAAGEDPTVIAVAGSVDISSDTVGPILAEFGLSNVGMLPLQASDFGAPHHFPLIGGLASGVPGQGVVAVEELGAVNIVHGRAGVPAAAQATGLIDLALTSWGYAPTIGAVEVPIGQADVSAQVTAMADGADAVVTALAPGQDQQVLLARQALGIEVPFIFTSSNFTQADLAALGDAVEGVTLINYFPPDGVESPGNTAFLADLASADALDQSGDLARITWTAFDFIDHVAAGMDTFDRASLIEAMNASSDYDAGGMLPTIDFTQPGPSPAFPRIVNLTMLVTEVRDGVVVAVGDPVFRPVFGG